jgi:SRSO17 transposase
MTTPRESIRTIPFIDQYCSHYEQLFPDVRAFEHFKTLQLGILADIKRKTLPAIAKLVNGDAQALHHFLTQAPWSVSAFRQRRLQLTQQALRGRGITVCIDETGDRKKGKKTDYVSRQYLGNVGKIDNGMVSVHAMGLLDNVTFPLLFEVFKPEARLQEEDTYKSKPKLGVELINKLIELGFKINLVLADCEYGEASAFINAVQKHKLDFVVAIRSNHGVWLGKDEHVRCNSWKEFDRIFSDGTRETRYIREIIFGHRRIIGYYQITTDQESLPSDSTWNIMTNLSGKIEKVVGNYFGDRTWVEYGFRQVKSELGWSDYKLTDYAAIEKWWEVVCSAYLMISLQTEVMKPVPEAKNREEEEVESQSIISQHKWWCEGQGWKHVLNNMRLLIQPFICCSLLLTWLRVIDVPMLETSLGSLIEKLNGFGGFLRI